jgi:hypothetical protein
MQNVDDLAAAIAMTHPIQKPNPYFTPEAMLPVEGKTAHCIDKGIQPLASRT